MARPLKKGLDYFPMDTKLDMKFQLLKAKYKLEGVGFIDLLFRVIYEEGYFIKLDPDNLIMLANDFSLTEERFLELLNFCIEKGFFDSEIFKKHNVLTSNGIQKRYFHKSLKREGKGKPEFLTPETELLLSEKGVSLDDKYTNKSKVNEIIEDKTKLKSLRGFTDSFCEWIEFRKQLKHPLTDSTVKKQLTFLDTQDDPIAVINQSIEKGWQGLFPIKINGKKIELDSSGKKIKQWSEEHQCYE